MHMTLNWCFTRVLIDAIGFNRCFTISSFNLATWQQFFKKRQNSSTITLNQHCTLQQTHNWYCNNIFLKNIFLKSPVIKCLQLIKPFISILIKCTRFWCNPIFYYYTSYDRLQKSKHQLGKVSDKKKTGDSKLDDKK